MAILKLVKPPGNHWCKPPEHPETQYGKGTVWACDDCGKPFELRYEDSQFDPGWYWKEMAEGRYIKTAAPPTEWGSYR